MGPTKLLRAGDERPAGRDLLILAAVLAAPFLLFLGHPALIEPDETRYAEIPREMIESGDFITPRLNYVLYFEKPPLLAWLNALSFSVLGQTELAARLPTALAGLLGVLWTYHAGRKVLGRRAAFLGAALLGTSIGWAVISRINIIDPLLAAAITGALGSFLIASRDGEPRKGLYFHLFWLFCALAVLAKGPVGLVLPGGVVFWYCILSRRWRLLFTMRLLTGIPLFLLVAAPWFILVAWKNPEFNEFFFIHEHLDRFLTTEHKRDKPFWFFFPVLMGLLLPWTFFLPLSLWDAWKRRREPTAGPGAGPDAANGGSRNPASARLFLTIWAALIFLFFSLSGSKLPPYILPILPALALLLGDTLSGMIEGRLAPSRLFPGLAAWGITAMGAAALLAALGPWVVPDLFRNVPVASSSFFIGGAAILAGGIVAVCGWRRGDFVGTLSGLWIGIALVEAIAVPLYMNDWATKVTAKDLAIRTAREAGTDGQVATYISTDHALTFYAKRRIIIVGQQGELKFGANIGDQSRWFLREPEKFFRLWDSGTPLQVLIDTTDLEKFCRSVKIQPRITYGAPKAKRALMTNCPER